MPDTVSFSEPKRASSTFAAREGAATNAVASGAFATHSHQRRCRPSARSGASGSKKHAQEVSSQFHDEAQRTWAVIASLRGARWLVSFALVAT